MPFDRNDRRRRRTALPALALLLALPAGAQAATFTVTSTGDDINDATTLRGAIAASEQSPDASDTIDITTTGTISTGANGPLEVYNGSIGAVKTLTISGPGADNLSIDGSGQARVFEIFQGMIGPITVSLSGVTISGGATNYGGAGMIVFPGEAVALSGVTFTGNAVTDSNGGALYEFGATVTMDGCTVDGNTAFEGPDEDSTSGGGLYLGGGSLTLKNSTVSNNQSDDYAGGIENRGGTLTLTGSSVTGNSTGINSGGIENDGTTTITTSLISGNTGEYGGGIYSSGSLTVSGSTISSNESPNSQGGGLFSQLNGGGSLSVTDTTISGNSAPYGAGAFSQVSNVASGSSVMSAFTGCTFTGNTASGEGGGVYSFIGASGSGSGAISTAFTNCTFSGNVAQGDFGGGLYIESQDSASGDAPLDTSLTNCTISGNSAPSGGGGIDIYGGTSPANSPITPTCTISSTIIAGNTLSSLILTIPQGRPIPNMPLAGRAPDISLESHADLRTGGSNLVGVADSGGVLIDGANHDQIGTAASPIDPRLGPLADNGGPTQTLALLSGSPALDADYNTAVTADQRGLPRPSGVRGDIGALEHQSPTATADAYTTNAGTALTVSAPGVLANDTTPDAASSSAVLATGPAHGQLSLNPDGSFNYTPVAGFAGTDTFTYQLSDGVTLSAPATVTLTIRDVTAPVTTATLSPGQPNGSSGYYNGPVQVQLSATDDASGVASTTYSIDGGPAQAYSGPFGVTSDGRHTVTFFSTDAAGNVEAPAKSVSFSLDATAPVTIASAQSTPAGKTVTLLPADNFSGVAATSYAVDGGATTPYTGPIAVKGNGAHSVVYFSKDKAGNAETVQTLSFTINIAAPVTTASVAGTQGKAGYYTGPVKVTLSATSTGSTVASTTYSVDGGPATPYTTPFTVSGDADHTVTYSSTDAAGDTESPNTLALKIDGTAPATQASASGPQNEAGVYTGPVTVTLTASDGSSGVAMTTYTVDGGVQTAYTGPITIGTEGKHAVMFFSTDKAGNAEGVQTLSLTLQLTRPVAHTFPAGLQLFSVPADYSAVPLGTALSQINPRLAVWDPGALQYDLAPSSLRPGQGYWARFGQATSLYDLGTPTPTSQPFSISLKKGWNMIGDPFPATVSLADTQVQSGGKTYPSLDAASKAGLVAFTLYSYAAGSTAYSTESGAGTLAPYSGYWLYAFTDCTLKISAP